MSFRLVNKASLQIKDICYRKSLLSKMQVVLSMFNRRGLPLPSALYQIYIKGEISNELGGESFLADVMTPEPEKSFVDIGANVGAWASSVAQKGNEVYAFEPSPKAYSILTERMKNFLNVHLYPIALSDEDTVGRLGYTAFSVSGVMNEENNGLPGGGTIDIAVRKLDSLNLPKVGVIKIDTEGYEAPILHGAKETIRKHKPRLIIEVHSGTGKAANTFTEELQKIEGILQNLNYSWILRHRQISAHGELQLQPFLIGNPAA